MQIKKKNTCLYNKKKDHFTNAAKDYHINKCVVNTMEKMSDKKKCVTYITGLMNANANEKNCTYKESIKDIENICDKHKQNFTFNDAKMLCIKKKEATDSFWKNKMKNEKMFFSSDSVLIESNPSGWLK